MSPPPPHPFPTSTSLTTFSPFNTLHRRRHDEEVQFCAFDILVEGGEDLQAAPADAQD